MSLELDPTLPALSRLASSAVAVRVNHQERSTTVLVAELQGALARHWEASRNTAFLDALKRDSAAPSAVVLVSPGALPRSSNGSVEVATVVRDFGKRRGYLKEEVQAWVINRLCEVLYLAPAEFDATLDWARHGVDSAVALELLADLEDTLRVRLPQTLAECRNPRELAAEATARVLDSTGKLPWWRSPWVTTEGL